MTQKQLHHARSSDGTALGHWTVGDGPPLVLVHGSLGDHSRWDALLPHLTPHVTVHAMDRRGRGASGDAPDYDLTREYEDVAAVVDAVAAEAGAPVDVYASSYGGICAFGAAQLTQNIGRLALYEGWPAVEPWALAGPAGTVERMEQLLGEGRREAALVTAYRDLVGLTEAEIAEVRSQPSWPARVAAVHTIVREERAFQECRFDPYQAGNVEVPVLLLVGEDSPVWGPQAETVMAALPDARITVLEGQGHVADLVAPSLVADALLPFLH